MAITPSEASSIAEIRRLCTDLLAPVEAPKPSIEAPDAAVVAAGGGSDGSKGHIADTVVASRKFGDVAAKPHGTRRLQFWSDEDVVRFLRGRKGDVPAAVEAIRKCVDWRDAFAAEYILDQPFPDHRLFRILTPHAYHKHDREGHPVYFERSGTIDVPRVMKVIDDDALVARHIWAMELVARLCRESSATLGKPVSKQTMIWDLKHLSLSPNSTAMALFKSILHIDQHYYPERLHQAFFINSPWIFQGLWAIISPLLDPVTKTKFQILGSNYKETLLKYIAPENLPVEYGGTCTCGMTVEEDQPRLESCISPPCTLSEAQMLELAGYRTMTLPSGASDSAALDVSVADGSAVIWYWHSEDKDVSFRATFAPAESFSSGAVQIVVGDSREKRHKGFFVPPAPGRFVLHFSNAHSRFTSKTLHVRLSAGHPSGECRIRAIRPFTDRKSFGADAASTTD